MASLTNDYSDLIEYTYIPGYTASYTTNETLSELAESGFLQTQDVIVFHAFYDGVFSDPIVNETIKAAHYNGTLIYSIDAMGSVPPSYFDYVSESTANDPVANYFSNMGTSGEGLENAENLLVYLTMKNKVTYIGWSENEALEMASLTNDYSDLIEYTYIPGYTASYTTNETLSELAESGFLQTQDVIVFHAFYDGVFSDPIVNETIKAAHYNGTLIYSIDAMGSVPPSYFDYVSESTANDPVANYFSNMGTSGEGLENAENLLVYLTMKNKVTYIGWSENEALEMASLTNDYSDLIEYTYIPGYTASYTTNETLSELAESGFLQTQDVIVFHAFYDGVFSDPIVNETIKAAHDNGTSIYSIDAMGSVPPSYFDYVSESTANDPVANYFSNMGTSGEGLENAENLLVYLATESPTLAEMAILGNNEVNFTEFVFVLGTEFNGVALNNATLDANISENLNVTIFTPSNPVPDGFDFSNYGVIFIESQNESVVDDWTSSIKSAKKAGAQVIGYNLSSSILLPNVNLYSDNFTDIERYWIQGGDTNMESMLKFMGQEFSGIWEGEAIPEAVVLQEKVNITFIIAPDTTSYYLDMVIDDRNVITDRFNITLLSDRDIGNITDFSGENFIIMQMLDTNDIYEMESALLDAKSNGAHVGLFSMVDVAGIDNIDEPYNTTMVHYLEEGGFENMESWIRYMGAGLEDTYIQYSPVAPTAIPKEGIYHPDAFPRIFESSAEYLEWYVEHGYNASAPTIGLISTHQLAEDTIFFTTEDAIIRYLEENGCNVIYATSNVCVDEDVEYFTMDDEVLVDTIISIKGFFLNYDDYEEGVEYLKEFNVPVIKGMVDFSQSPDEYNNSVAGLSSTSIPAHVNQAELEGCLDYIWVAGQVPVEEDSTTTYNQPLMSQVEFMCDRAIGWADLGRTENADKKVTIIYYNHEGGKNNIGASYLDIGSSFTLLLERMQNESYYIGNGSIPNGSKFIDLFIESRNVGTWAPEELDKVVDSGMVTLLPTDEYLGWYNTLPESVRTDVEARWGEAPGNVMVYENESGKYFVIPTVQLGNINFVPQPTRAMLSDESVLYHDKELPPTHQYLATYFWINQIYDADAMIHFGCHGTEEWLPGKEVGLWRYDYPSIMVADTPVIYPYIMDNVGEGTQAKRRGNAVMIDHLTSPIVEAGLYVELATLHDKIHDYKDAKSSNNTALMASYRNTTIELYDSLFLADDLGVTCDELNAMNDTEFEYFLDANLHDRLHQLQDTLIPLGIHTFGVVPEDEKLVAMVKSMLRSDFIDDIYNVIPKGSGDEEDWENEADAYGVELLNLTLVNGTDVVSAQDEVLGFNDSNITADLNIALNYSALIGQTSRETDQLLRALDAEYIEPGPGNDPIRNIEALPTGRNFYSFDQRRFPDNETYWLGYQLTEEMLAEYQASHNGTYPDKVSYILWSVETMRHHGLMEAQIYALLGVKPHRDDLGSIDYLEVIDLEDLNRPRIDVVLLPSGLYRDTFPFQVGKLDEAVRMVAELDENCSVNYVRCNSLRMEAALVDMGYDNETAEYLSRSRIFTQAPGAYGTGMSEAISASETWGDNESKLADLYIARMANIYGEDMWGENFEDVLRMNLVDIDAAVHSDTSNIFGVLDNDDFYSEFGALGMVVRALTGETPEMYIADLQNVDDLHITTYEEVYRTELRARYFNPKWIEGMMEYDYAGAREMMKFIEYEFGTAKTLPDMVTDNDWNMIYDVYMNDRYDLGVDEFLKENPYQYQAMTARMLDAARTGLWEDVPEEVLNDLAERFAESVAAEGVACCHHTCGNPLLADYTSGLLTTPTIHRSSNDVAQAKIVESSSSNQTSLSEGSGYDDSNVEPLPDNYVEGYEMTEESQQKAEESGGMSFSGADVVGSILVLAAVGVMYLGYRRRGI